MSFLDLKSAEDRLMVGVFVGSVILLAISHGFSYGWWAFLTVPLFIALIFGMVTGLNYLRDRARRKDLQRRIDAEVDRALAEAGLEPIEKTSRPEKRGTWASMWTPKRDR